MQYYIYRIHRYKAAERVLWTYSKGDAKHKINRLKHDNPRAKYEKEWGPINPDAKWAASNTKRGAVGLLGSVEQLQAAISAAGDGLVVERREVDARQRRRDGPRRRLHRFDA